MSGDAGYWEQRAQRFAGQGRGLRAVCSFGMPGFYNAAIDLAQRLALRPWLRVPPGTRVLDAGCGVGRWSRLLALRGARVTGVDLSPTMVEEARRRARAEGLEERCRFEVADLPALAVEGEFDLVLAVTVVQHVVEPEAVAAAARRLAERVAPGGRLVLLEAAPRRRIAPMETATLRFRSEEDYQRLFEVAGLRLRAITGVDPLPLKIRFLPVYARLPRAVGAPILALLTAASLPVELLWGRSWAAASWHKVFVLERG